MKGNFTRKVKQVIALLLLMILSASCKYFVSSANEENKEKAQAQVELALEKYVNYDVDNEKGVLVQLGLETGIEYENEENQLPVLVSGVQLYAPQIEGEFPNSVEVEREDTAKENANQEPHILYNDKTGEIRIIKINSLELGGEVAVEAQSENVAEKYSIILNYGSKSYTAENKERELEFKTKTVKILGDAQNTRISVDKEQTEKVQENKGEIINLKTNTEEIYNGYIKANKKYGTKYSTNYEETVEIEIGKTGLGEKTSVSLETKIDNELTDKILFETTQINKQQVLKILGENGNLKITDETGKILGEVNKETKVNEDGNYILRYKEAVSQIKIETTTPQKAGTIQIINNKKIAPEVENENLQVKETNKLKVEKIVKDDKEENSNNTTNNTENKVNNNNTANNTQNIVNNNNTANNTENKVNNNNITNNEATENAEEVQEIYSKNEEKTLEMKPSNTSIKVTLDNTEWTNEKQNEVNFEIELQNNNSKYNLFKNPSIEIKLPEEASKVILEEEPTLINANGLQIAGTQYNEESKTIKLELYGEQKQYLPANIAQGTKIELPVIVILNDKVEEKEEKIQINCKNINVLDDGKNEDINGEKVITLHNFNPSIQDDNKSTLVNTAFIQEKQKVAQAGTTVQTDSGLEVTITPVRGDVALNDGDTVYEGEFIRYEITAKNTTDHDIENVKFEAEIPNDLKFIKDLETDGIGVSQYTYQGEQKLGQYGSYFESEKNKEINIESIKKGETKKDFFEVRVKKLNEEIINDGCNTKEEFPSYKERHGGNNSSLTWIEEKEISTIIRGFIEESNFYDNSFNNIIKNSNVSAEVQTQFVKRGEYKFNIKVENQKHEEAIIKMEIPECFDIYDINAKYTLENNVACIKAMGNCDICVDLVKTRDPKSEIIKTTLSINDTYKSNQNILQIDYNALKIDIESDTEGEEVKHGEEIEYKVTITNLSKVSEENEQNGWITPNIHLNISDDLRITKCIYDEFYYDEETGEIIKQESTSSVSNIDMEINIPYQEVFNMRIYATPLALEKKKKAECNITASERSITMNVDNSSLLMATNFEPKVSRTITHTLLPLYQEETEEENENPTTPETTENLDNPEKPSNQDTPTNPENSNEPSNQETPNNSEEETTKRYSVSGIVWNDKNGDGIKQEEEQALNGIEVYLLDNQGNYLRKTVTTNEKYAFNEINKGEYYIVVKYDTNKYHITKCITKGENTSKATEQKIKLENKEITAGITELLNIQSDTENINIGLTENKKFDLKVENYITKVTVETSNGTEVTEFDNLTLAKKEIKAKEINGAKITVEYKIKVTNNGEVDGSVGKIVDKLPAGFKLISSQTVDWIKNNENEIISTQLNNKKISPGESKEISLIIMANLNEDFTGTYTNNVKIENISNEQNSEETSIQNNTAKAELIISISTGAYTYFVVFGIIVFIVILFTIKFNKLRKISLYMCSILMVFASVLTLVNSNAKANNINEISPEGGKYWFYDSTTPVATKQMALIRDIWHAYRMENPSFNAIVNWETYKRETIRSWDKVNIEGTETERDWYIYLLQEGEKYYIINTPTPNLDKTHYNNSLPDAKWEFEPSKLTCGYEEGEEITEWNDDHTSSSLRIHHHDGDCWSTSYWVVRLQGQTTYGRRGPDDRKIEVDKTQFEIMENSGEFGKMFDVEEYTYAYEPSVGHIEYSEQSDDPEPLIRKNEKLSENAIKANTYRLTFYLFNSYNELRVFREKGHYNNEGMDDLANNHYCIDLGSPAYPDKLYGWDTNVRGSDSEANYYLSYLQTMWGNGLKDAGTNGWPINAYWNRYSEGTFALLNANPFIGDEFEDYKTFGNGAEFGPEGAEHDGFYNYKETMGKLTLYKGTLKDKGEKITTYSTYITDKNKKERKIPQFKIEGDRDINQTKAASLNQDNNDYVYIGKDSKNLKLEGLGEIVIYKKNNKINATVETIGRYNYGKCNFTLKLKDGTKYTAELKENSIYIGTTLTFYNCDDVNEMNPITNLQGLINASNGFYIKIKKEDLKTGILSLTADVSRDFCWEFSDGTATGCLCYYAAVKNGDGTYSEARTANGQAYQRVIGPPTTLEIIGEREFNVNKQLEWTWFEGGFEILKLDEFARNEQNITYNHLDELEFAIKIEDKKYIMCDSNGNYNGVTYNAPVCKFKTDKEGKTYLSINGERYTQIKMIIGLPTNKDGSTTYQIEELKNVPEYLKDYYGNEIKNRETGKVDLYSGDLLRTNEKVVRYKNERTHTNIEFRKMGQTNTGTGTIPLKGIKFAIYDDTLKGWVKVTNGIYNDTGVASNYNKDNCTISTNYRIDVNHVVSVKKLSAAEITYSNQGDCTVFETNDQGWVFLRRFPLENNHSYYLYEIDVGVYDELYKAWGSDEHCSRYYKRIKFTPKAEADGIFTVEDNLTTNGEILNIQDYGAFKIRKRISNTQAPLAGIGFKIKVKTDQGPRWLKLKRRNDNGEDVDEEGNQGDETRLFADEKYDTETSLDYYLIKDFSQATLLKLQDDGETETVYKVPIYTDESRKEKIEYSVYEVYIPGENDPDGFENLRDILTLDNSGEYKKLWEIKNDSDLPKKAVAEFTLESYIDPNKVWGRYRSVVTVPHTEEWDSGIENDQAYITIKGNVWQELLGGKNTVSAPNNVKDDGEDINIQGLEVKLLNNGEYIKKVPDYGKEYNENLISITDEKGNYEFDHVLLNDAKSQEGLIKGNYKVCFEYDGVTYQSVVPYAESKSEEDFPEDETLSRIAEQYYLENDEADNINRREFNEKWDKIENGRPIDRKSLEYQEEIDANKYKNVNLKEESQIYKLEYTKNNDGTIDNSQPVIVKGNAVFKINATTKEGKLNHYYNKLVEIRKGEKQIARSIDNINLGLYYRERPNLTLQKDEHMAHVEVAGKAYTYFYSSKIKAPEGEEVDSGLYDVKFDAKTERSLPVYEADVNYYSPEDENDPNYLPNAPSNNPNDKLKATITYKIKLQNASTNLYATINSINEYYTQLNKGDLEIKNIYLSDEENLKDFSNVTDITSKTTIRNKPEVTYDNKIIYTGREIAFNEPIKLSSATANGHNGKSVKYLYIKYQINDIQAYFYDVYPDNGAGIPKSNIENYAEIASYSLYKNDFVKENVYHEYNRYPGVDKTSIPGNMNVASYKVAKEKLRNKETLSEDDMKVLEDDSDNALGLRVVKAEERTVEGIVFEDAPVIKFNDVREIDRKPYELHKYDDEQSVWVGEQNEKIDVGEERIGDGIYNPTDTLKNMKYENGNKYKDEGINGVRVNIKDVDKDGNLTGKKVLRWQHDSNNTNHGYWTEVSGVVTSNDIKTGKDGRYSISGLAPGEYLVQFEWGAKQGERDVRDYKCTVFTNPAGHVDFADNNKIVMNDGKAWIYAEETTQYSDAIDNYETRLAVDDKELGLGNGKGNSITEDLENVTMVSSTAPFKLGIEMKTQGNDIDNGVFYEETDVEYYNGKKGELKVDTNTNEIKCLEFHIDSIDFGLIERPRQALGVEKHLISVKINTADGKQVAIAYIGEDDKLTVITGAEYLSGGYDLGFLLVQVDKAIQESMTAQLSYKISVKNYSELDYDSPKYYFTGEIDTDPIKLKADELYDYIGGSLLHKDDYRWEKVGDTANKYLYTKSVGSTESTVNLEKTETEKDYLANNVDNHLDEYDYAPDVMEFYRKLYADWDQKWNAGDSLDAIIVKIREAKLKDKDIVKPSSVNNSLVAHSYFPGEVNTSEMVTSREISQSDADVRFDNDVEIAKVKYDEDIKTARRTEVKYAPLYARAEWVSITPATGENKDYVGLTIVAIGNLTMFACGIILIKRLLKKRNQ